MGEAYYMIGFDSGNNEYVKPRPIGLRYASVLDRDRSKCSGRWCWQIAYKIYLDIDCHYFEITVNGLS